MSATHEVSPSLLDTRSTLPRWRMAAITLHVAACSSEENPIDWEGVGTGGNIQHLIIGGWCVVCFKSVNNAIEGSLNSSHNSTVHTTITQCCKVLELQSITWMPMAFGMWVSAETMRHNPFAFSLLTEPPAVSPTFLSPLSFPPLPHLFPPFLSTSSPPLTLMADLACENRLLSCLVILLASPPPLRKRYCWESGCSIRSERAVGSRPPSTWGGGGGTEDDHRLRTH